MDIPTCLPLSPGESSRPIRRYSWPRSRNFSNQPEQPGVSMDFIEHRVKGLHRMLVAEGIDPRRLHGSLCPRGNTDTLAEAVLEGARSAGCGTESHALRALHLHHCTGCGGCGTRGRLCIFRDDGEMLYQAVIAADVLLFVTPVDWYGPP